MITDYSLYFIADNTHSNLPTLISIIKEILDCGITCVQLRMKNAARKEIVQTGEQLQAILKPKQIPLLINDYVDIAKEINADGVHLGQSDVSCQQARQLLGPDKIIGLSIENIQQAQNCRNQDVDYYGVGPVFNTCSKADAAAPIGLLELKNIVQQLPKPVVAIGGINAENAARVLQTGVAGIAVISAILAAPAPVLAATKLASIIINYKNKVDYGEKHA